MGNIKPRNKKVGKLKIRRGRKKKQQQQQHQSPAAFDKHHAKERCIFSISLPVHWVFGGPEKAMGHPHCDYMRPIQRLSSGSRDF